MQIKTRSFDDAPEFKVGPGFSVKHGNKSFKVHGRMHWDVGYYGEVKDQDVYGSGTNIRRARLGLKGKQITLVLLLPLIKVLLLRLLQILETKLVLMKCIFPTTQLKL